jgi:hypothetical protein
MDPEFTYLSTNDTRTQWTSRCFQPYLKNSAGITTTMLNVAEATPLL